MATDNRNRTDVAAPQPPAPAAAGRGFWAWLERKLVHPMFLFVALLIAALMVRPLIYGEGVNPLALGLVGVLILLAFLDLADVSRFEKPQTAHKLEDIPPLGLVTGSVRALTGLLLLIGFFFFVLVAPKIISDSDFLEKVVMLIGGWLGAVIGFYFGSRAAEKHEGPPKGGDKPPGDKPGATGGEGR